MNQPHLTIAVLTYQRPKRLLHAVREFPGHIVDCENLATVDVLIVDNDPAASARSTIEELQAPWIRYVHEPTPGIAAARNRALAESQGSRLLAFIDDDEVPRDGWLRSLLTTWNLHDADAVSGRLVSVFGEDIDPWILAGGFFRRAIHETGTPVAMAATNNLLLDLESVRSKRLHFDESLGMAGGEDSLFTSQLVNAGGRIIFCQESIVEDEVDSKRTTRQWVCRRAYSHGHTYVMTMLRRTESPISRLRIRVTSFCGGIARMLVGWSRHFYGRLTRTLYQEARGARGVHRGRGVFDAAIGIAYEEYARY
ncbi:MULTISPECIES: glycosyltransferase family 2 protein [Micrococcaceae]|uniref:glycosyltransferase family 2 protein n=1 Tax=Micrococcaceae TaxID=1268 RepID=UPI000BB9B3B1|nr:glycosyltransferase [Glutamicibacter sp. BW78]PCC25753.1 hypothetical protein CIK75_04520 [Glutamicibacter sp. BW78]